jgi:hypothetical protein
LLQLAGGDLQNAVPELGLDRRDRLELGLSVGCDKQRRRIEHHMKLFVSGQQRFD